MNKTTSIFFVKIIGFCLFLTLLIPSFGYTQSPDLGQKAPPLMVWKWLKGKRHDSFKLGQVYLVEFGATWCKPCKPALIHLDELAKRHDDELNVISIFTLENQKGKDDQSYLTNVQRYLEQMDRHITYSIAVDDPRSTLADTWIQGGVPQAYIINKEGFVVWTGNPNDPEMDIVLNEVISNRYNLSELVGKDEKSKSQVKEFDPSKPLFVDGNGGEEIDFLFRSLLTEWKDNIRAYGNTYIQSPKIYELCGPECKEDHSFQRKSIQFTGFPLKNLYKAAYTDTVSDFPYELPKIREFEKRTSYGSYWPELILEVNNSEPFLSTFKSDDYRYNYSLTVPMDKGNAAFLKKAMQADLKKNFGYAVTVEKRMMPYWSLVSTGQFDQNKQIEINEDFKKRYFKKFENKTATFVRNGDMSIILNQLFFLDQTRKEPILDETTISEGDAIIEGDLKNFNGFKSALESVGLKLVRKKKEMKVIVIRDNHLNN